jgi:hypothetical protein
MKLTLKIVILSSDTLVTSHTVSQHSTQQRHESQLQRKIKNLYTQRQVASINICVTCSRSTAVSGMKKKYRNEYLNPANNSQQRPGSQ